MILGVVALFFRFSENIFDTCAKKTSFSAFEKVTRHPFAHVKVSFKLNHNKMTDGIV